METLPLRVARLEKFDGKQSMDIQVRPQSPGVISVTGRHLRESTRPQGHVVTDDERPVVGPRTLKLLRPDGSVASTARGTGAATRLTYAVTNADLASHGFFKCRISAVAGDETSVPIQWSVEYPIEVETARFDLALLNDLLFRVREDLNLQIHLEDGHSFVTWSESVAELLGGNRETFIAPDSVTVLNVDEILFLVLGPFSKLIAPVIDAAASVQIRIRDLNGRIARVRVYAHPADRIPRVEALVSFETEGSEGRVSKAGIGLTLEISRLEIAMTFHVTSIPIPINIGPEVTVETKVTVSGIDVSEPLANAIETGIAAQVAAHQKKVTHGLTTFFRSLARLDPTQEVYPVNGLVIEDGSVAIKYYTRR